MQVEKGGGGENNGEGGVTVKEEEEEETNEEEEGKETNEPNCKEGKQEEKRRGKVPGVIQEIPKIQTFSRVWRFTHPPIKIGYLFGGRAIYVYR